MFQGKLLLLDFNPFGQVTDGLMYTWEELTDSDGELKGTDTETKVTGICLQRPPPLHALKAGGGGRWMGGGVSSE